MFQSPLKTVTEKLKPTQSKSSISSLKFERPSDFKKFIGFIKNETQELEKIKLPTRSEVEPKSKSGGVFGLLGLGLLGGLGSAFGGGSGGDDDSNLRLGSAGGTSQQLSSGLLLTKNITRVRDISKTKTTVGTSKVLGKDLETKGKKFERVITKEKADLKNKQKIRNKTIKKIYKNTYANAVTVGGADLEVERIILNAQNDPDLKKIERQARIDKGYSDLLDKINEDELLKTQQKDVKAAEVKLAKDLKRQQRLKINLFDDFLKIDLGAVDPNLKIKGFSIKDTLDKTFDFVGKNTKGLRGNLKKLAKTKVGGVSSVGLAKGLGKLAAPIDFGVTLPLAFYDLGFVDLDASEGIIPFKGLKAKVGRNNIVTGLYDMFTSFYNAGVEGLGFSDAFKRLYISKPKNKTYFDLFTFKTKKLKVRDAIDAKNKKILEARRMRQMFNFDQPIGTNFSPDMQLPKSNVFASQKTDGAEFVIPFDYSTSGIYDFNFPIYQKLFKQ